MEVPYVTFPTERNSLAWKRELRGMVANDLGDTFSKHVLATEPRCVSSEGLVKVRYTLAKFSRQTFHVSIFGSARMGVSLSPTKAKLFVPFGFESDLDIVMFSNDLFNELQVAYLNQLAKAGSWRLKASQDDFYISRGWYRPDKHARAQILFKAANAIQDEVFDRRIKCALALFRDKSHYSAYLRYAHEMLRTNLKTSAERTLP